MKNSKAAGPCGVVADMSKAAGNAGVTWITDVCNESYERRKDTRRLMQELNGLRLYG